MQKGQSIVQDQILWLTKLQQQINQQTKQLIKLKQQNNKLKALSSQQQNKQLTKKQQSLQLQNKKQINLVQQDGYLFFNIEGKALTNVSNKIQAANSLLQAHQSQIKLKNKKLIIMFNQKIKQIHIDRIFNVQYDKQSKMIIHYKQKYQNQASYFMFKFFSDNQRKKWDQAIFINYKLERIQSFSLDGFFWTQFSSESDRFIKSMNQIPQKDKNSSNTVSLFKKQSHQNQKSFSSEQMDRMSQIVMTLQKGYVMEKCALNGWSTHKKKIYLSMNEIELCYRDLENKELKIVKLIDIINIEYRAIGSGIRKHILHPKIERCLIITTRSKNDEIKNLEFYSQKQEQAKQFCEYLLIYLKQTEEKKHIKTQHRTSTIQKK